jgi:protein-disulfide isomerase
MLSPIPTARAADAKAIRVTSGNLITDPDGQPTVVLSLYEDSLCPYCRKFEHTFGATNVEHTPTVRINGQDYELSTPEALVASIEQLVPPVASLAPVVHPTVASLAPRAPVPGIDAPTP